MDGLLLTSHLGIGCGLKLVPQQDQKRPEGVWPISQACLLDDSQETRVLLRITQVDRSLLARMSSEIVL